ncbi:MAG: DUF2231 domain-containing protein [Bacteroidota bacterium]
MSIPFHPALVHFPVAFLMLAAGLYVYHAWNNDAWSQKTAWFLHIAGTIGLLLAIISGRSAKASITFNDRLVDLMDWHETLGYSSLVFSVVLLGWFYVRGNRQEKTEKWIFALVFLLFVGLALWGSHFGGTMVYEEGAGVLTSNFSWK